MFASSCVSKKDIGARQLNEKSEGKLVERLKHSMWDLCKWGRETFPGSQPISFGRRNLRDVTQRPYVIGEKSDGERHMLITDNQSQGVYLVDRRFNFYRIQLHLPNKDHTGMINTTLLDGEVVEDGHDTEEKTVRFLVYDAVAVDGQCVRDFNLMRRLQAFLEGVLMPRRQLSPEKRANDAFQVYLKDFFEVTDCDTVMNFGKRLPHECDGLIFTPVMPPYIAGTCRQLLKWKPAHMNTADFAVELVMGDSMQEFHVKLLAASEGVQVFQGIWLSRSGPHWQWLTENTRQVNGAIIECNWDPNTYTFVPSDAMHYVETGDWVPGGWQFQRIRTDRTSPNDERVVGRVKKSIADSVTFEELSDYIHKNARTQKVCEMCKMPSWWSKSSDSCDREDDDDAKRQKQK
ncbi:mRNA capping enzyme alpha subunit, putative [Perkinsus marinus ATCC 50983]|uniref:mRNA guanylyltransferase n=1 Tax=Perkinsus marinus (strain ATCC 50983 / TXsc) TaxID=423536 RepID=C5LBV9_PERM5|nr:mRNA capping enzyme alpha subunit, putative [Perkinsus marinus ATCC 50983]EER05930.1 mRNA capping enzyme alpha subunit, putative [Perkinsus marinus ATCC 50983]|eukprot:XP_002774114.1 mRNA capping enzyme alpha subunit, putative [Perkinsus marinus ATCC 50983]